MDTVLWITVACMVGYLYWRWTNWRMYQDFSRRAQLLAKERNVEFKTNYLDVPLQGGTIYILRDIHKNTHRLLDYTVDLQKKYGKFMRAKLPFRPYFLRTNDPDILEYILKTNFSNYVKGPTQNDIMDDFLGIGIFNSDGSQWKKQRASASHLFSVRELKSMVDVFTKHSTTVVDLIRKDLGKEVDVQEMFQKYTLDSFGEIAFGVDIGSLTAPEVPFATAFENVNHNTFMRFINPLWKVTKLWSKSERELKTSLKFVDNYVYGIIEDRKKMVNEERQDLISLYIRMIRNGDQPPTEDKELRDFVTNFMVAGRDTTAALLTFCCYMLAINQDKLDKVVREIDTERNGSIPDFENVKSLKYLKAVLDETLRLWPPVPLNARETIEDDILPGGIFVPAGTRVAYSLYAIGRSPEYWDNPEKFQPERFLEQLKKPTAFMPFHFGNRLCLGQHMAYLEARIAMCFLLQNFTFKLAPGQTVTCPPGATLRAKEGIKLVFSPRT